MFGIIDRLRGRRRVLCVGCSASSGSTLFADLLDSCPGVICGPELNIFCIPQGYLYDEWVRDRARQRKAFKTHSPRLPTSKFFNTKHLAAVGLDEAGLDRLITESRSLPQFVARFADHYCTFRNRKASVFAEKTPLNIGCTAEFLKAFPSGLFAIVVRDGRSVVGSLRRRGYPLYEAALIWLNDMALGRKALAASRRVVQVRYEDLVADPYKTTAAVVRRVGVRVDPAAIEAGLVANTYRQNVERVATWRANQFTGAIVGNLDYRADLNEDEVALLESLTLTVNGERVSFQDMLSAHGYEPVARGSAAPTEMFDRWRAEYEAKPVHPKAPTGLELRVG